MPQEFFFLTVVLPLLFINIYGRTLVHGADIYNSRHIHQYLSMRDSIHICLLISLIRNIGTFSNINSHKVMNPKTPVHIT